jgi:hypothetical protein
VFAESVIRVPVDGIGETNEDHQRMKKQTLALISIVATIFSCANANSEPVDQGSTAAAHRTVENRTAADAAAVQEELGQNAQGGAADTKVASCEGKCSDRLFPWFA